jgi:hypothetical protein
LKKMKREITSKKTLGNMEKYFKSEKRNVIK